jgi:hypothetical protein
MRIELQYDVQVVAHFGLACAKWWAGRRGFRRGVGFWCFLDSNVLWIIWGWHTDAYALIVLQLCLAAMNSRGAKKNEAA